MRLSRRALVTGLLASAALPSLRPVEAVLPALDMTLYVNPRSPLIYDKQRRTIAQTFATIQEAIDFAARKCSGNVTIQLAPGVYSEFALWPGMDMLIRGERDVLIRGDV